MAAINDHMNAIPTRFGRAAMQNIGKEIGRFAVTTMDRPWQVTKDLIGGAPAAVYMIVSMEQSYLDSLIEELPTCDSIVGIGGGQAVDAAKYIAWQKGIRLVTIPTILSTDAFVTEAAGVRRDHRVVYIGKVRPDPLVIDYEVIRTAPTALNIAGIGDLLSMHTACFDWELAEKQGRSEYPFSADIVRAACAILTKVSTTVGDIREVTDAGIRALVEGYMEMNVIAHSAGHWRFEEGSEHFLFYELEERLKRPFIHGHIVGLGIYLMSRLQENDYQNITQMMNDVNLAYFPSGMDIPRAVLQASLKNCHQFVKQRNLWFSILNVKEITDDWIEWATADLETKNAVFF
ncbi:iron-containing alcohol dehydrogenase [candidate division KSB1 bacterium]|nr:iron-containing alcohol dehydrogenase [candidate division KSB1 bacterium]RQW09096.1 MAG: iron-containing alcohol dehydrogenase [candidate division KSB1 bacterium]